MNLLSSLLDNLNYGTIFILMMLESTVIPVPSEFVVTPAAYYSAAGNMDVLLVVAFATLGADVGPQSITQQPTISDGRSSTASPTAA